MEISLRSSGPTIMPLPPGPLNHILNHLFLEQFQQWWLHYLSAQPVPMHYHFFWESSFSEYPICTSPFRCNIDRTSDNCYLGEADPQLATTSFQALVESSEVNPEPPFLNFCAPETTFVEEAADFRKLNLAKLLLPFYITVRLTEAQAISSENNKFERKIW